MIHCRDMAVRNFPKCEVGRSVGRSPLAIVRLQQIRSDSDSYAVKFKVCISAGTPMVGNTADVTEVHTTIVQPYIDRLCKNIEKRLGDSTTHVSIAASLFNPQKFDKLDLKQQHQHIQTLASFFQLDKAALTEWTCYRNYLARHRDDTDSQIFKDLLVSPVRDSYPQLAQLAGIILACLVGTAGMSRMLQNYKLLHCCRLWCLFSF